MDGDIIEGKWEQLKGKIRATWGKFTDNDLTVMKGRSQEVIGKLQELYGYSEDRARKEWKKFAEEQECCCSSADKKRESNGASCR